MQSATIMDLLTTPTTFPLKIDWEGKMEPSSPSDYSQQDFAEEELIFDADTYDFCNEGLFNNALIDLEDLKPDPSELLKRDVLVLPVGKLMEDLCFDDKLKISTGESVLLGNYGPLPTVVEDEFYSFAMQPDAKAANQIINNAAATETLMEFDRAKGGSLELVNHLTPPQTPPQTTAFGGVVGCVLPMQSAAAPLQSVPMAQQQQQQFQQLYAPMVIPQHQQQQQLSFPDTNNSSEYYIVDEYATMAQIGGLQQQLQQQQQQQLQETVPLVEPLQQVPGFSFSTEGYTAQQMCEMENIVRSLQQQMEEDASSSASFHGDDDDSCGFSEAGSIESASSASMVARSPVYSDSAESSAYYGGSSGGSTRRNDADDEDWCPSKSKKLNQRNGGLIGKKRTGGTGSTRPYGGRGTEEKKSRKKEQNKNAATRYRQKKKAEIEEILIEESKLRERNEELKTRSQDLGREISCIKKLMREFCKSKGLI